MIINRLKWVSTLLVLTGIFFTNINYYPVNIFFHGLGVLGWTVTGFYLNDKAIMANFGFQIPIFIFGIINFFFKNF
tara:strand:- start:56 stop:283 length:228 start_codon:yes stop_codon:yes gene_type:complete